EGASPALVGAVEPGEGAMPAGVPSFEAERAPEEGDTAVDLQSMQGPTGEERGGAVEWEPEVDGCIGVDAVPGGAEGGTAPVEFGAGPERTVLGDDRLVGFVPQPL